MVLLKRFQPDTQFFMPLDRIGFCYLTKNTLTLKFRPIAHRTSPMLQCRLLERHNFI